MLENKYKQMTIFFCKIFPGKLLTILSKSININIQSKINSNNLKSKIKIFFIKKSKKISKK